VTAGVDGFASVGARPAIAMLRGAPGLHRNSDRTSRVQWGEMKRPFSITLAAVALLCAVAPASASATIIELGSTKTKLSAPQCPKGVTASQCDIVLTRTTGLETIRDSHVYPTTVTKSGLIVAWTVGLASLSKSQATARSIISKEDSAYGGPTAASIVVLKPSGKRFGWTVVQSSPLAQLQPFLGTVVQFPLATPLQVVRGETIGLSIPTWAPVISYDLPLNEFAYRQSRTSNCKTTAASESAQVTAKQSTRYICDYPGARVEYSATEVTNPVQPKASKPPPSKRRAPKTVKRRG